MRRIADLEAALAAAERALADSEALRGEMFEQSAIIKWMNDPSGKCLQINRSFRQFVGMDLPKFVFADTVHPDDMEIRDRSRLNIVSGLSYAAEFRLRHSSGFYRWLDVRVAPLRNSQGEIAAWIGNAIDIDDRVRAQEKVEKQLETTKLLMYELNHRVRNTLTIILAMLRQTFRGASSLEECQKKFEGRLYGLAATHDVLVAQDWSGASLADVIAVELTPICIDKSQWRVRGPSVILNHTQTTALGILFHELATNAVMHGALKDQHGTLDLSWFIADERLRIVWKETNGEPVAIPSNSGFGTRLINQIGKQLLGKVSINFLTDGVRAEVDIPLKLPS